VIVENIEKIIDYAMRPYLRDYVFTKFINSSEHGLADLIEVEPTSISAGDENIIQVVEWFRMNGDGVPVVTGSEITTIDEIVSVDVGSSKFSDRILGNRSFKGSQQRFCSSH